MAVECQKERVYDVARSLYRMSNEKKSMQL